MNDRQTTVLIDRLRALADDPAPQFDVGGQVRAARNRHRSRRRSRVVVLTAAAAAAAVVVGTVAVADVISTGPRGGEVAAPTMTASASPTPPGTETTAPPPTPTTAPASTSAVEPAGPVDTPTSGPTDGWEQRTFEGVVFEVPPGARSADTVDTTPVTSWMDGPSLTWNGPLLADGEPSYIRVWIVETYEGGLTPSDGGGYYDVPGAEIAYGGVDETSSTRVVWLNMLAGDRQVVVGAVFAGGVDGDQMAQHLIASLSVD